MGPKGSCWTEAEGRIVMSEPVGEGYPGRRVEDEEGAVRVVGLVWVLVRKTREVRCMRQEWMRTRWESLYWG